MFHSQEGEDRFIVENQLTPAVGVFVDVGAADPIYLSNTYHFENKGWTGLCVEAHPEFVARLRQHRSCTVEHCAIKAYEGFTRLCGPVDLGHKDGPLMHTTLDHWGSANSIEVTCHRLETILAKHKIGKIDLLSIDVEGSELEVWDSMNWENHQPGLVIIEFATHGRASCEEAVMERFRKLPYRLVGRTKYNLVFQLAPSTL